MKVQIIKENNNRRYLVYPILFLLFLILFFKNSNAQCPVGSTPQWQWKTHSNWFFGNGILATFPGGNGSMVISSVKAGNNPSKFSYEGTSAFSDEKGGLRYFSNGNQLWKEDGSFFNSLLLAGNENGATPGSSAVEGVMFIRHPLNPSKLYIFTVDDSPDANGSPTKGLNYSVLDISTNAITTPVCLIESSPNVPVRTTELLAATFHSNGQDIWVSTIGSPTDPSLSSLNYNNVYSFLLTSTGVTTTPVVSQMAISGTKIILPYEDRGSLKFSWDGTKAATVRSSQYGDQYAGIVIYDFNNTTGIFSNPKGVGAVSLGGGASVHDGINNVYDGNYDCEFSPDSKGLYVVGYDYYNSGQTVPTPSFAQLLWVDFTNYTTPSDINAHIKVVSTPIAFQGQLKLGGDGKLYQASFFQPLNVFSGDLNNPFSLTNPVAKTTQTTGSLSCRRGLPHMFIPPSDYIEISPVSTLTTCGSPINLQANWWCAGTNAENPSGVPTGWGGTGITDQANGVFNPLIAGVGVHEITYTLSAFQKATILIEVGSEGCTADTACPWMSNSTRYQWKTASNWYFGDGILGNFPGGTGSMQISTLPSDHLSYEGTATYSDVNGVLKYYSNGNKLWKANGTLITSQLFAGNENNVTQGSSAVEGILFVKHPEDDRHLYIFTVDDNETNSSNWKGLNYQVLDMTSDVLSSPVNLKDASNSTYRTTEQLDAVFHANGKDIWVTTRHSSKDGDVKFQEIYSYKLTLSGVNPVPVVSQAPLASVALNPSADRGSLKFSWNGKRAVTTNQITNAIGVTLYDFDNATGLFSNPKSIARIPAYYWNSQLNQFVISPGALSPGTTIFEGDYDAEFSPNSKGLYVTYSSSVTFLDVTLNTEIDINLSAKIVQALASGTNDYQNDLKIGGDGKLYQCMYGSSTVRVFSGDLNHPVNANNSLNVTISTLPTSGRLSRRGFPNMFLPPSDYFNIVAQNPLLTCGTPVDLQVNWFCKGTNAEDPTGNANGWSGTGVTDAANGIFNPAVAGVGSHQIIYTLNSIKDTIFINVSSQGCVIDTVCDSCLTFTPIAGKRYVLSAWVTEGNDELTAINSENFSSSSIQLAFLNSSGTIIQTMSFTPSGNVVDGWQRIEKDFVIPLGTKKIDISFVNSKPSGFVYFDDFRIHPFNASMTSYIYNPETMQLDAQLDENNFYTQYTYDEEGNLVKSKVETIDGVRTAAETRSNIQRK